MKKRSRKSAGRRCSNPACQYHRKATENYYTYYGHAFCRECWERKVYLEEADENRVAPPRWSPEEC